MAVKLGYFIYENAGTGCLLSKYCNAGLDAPLTESASRISLDPDPAFLNSPFCGDFLSTWVENVQNLQTRTARLIITPKRDRAGNPLLDLYTVRWQDSANAATRFFHGEAMLYKGMLIGGYE
ncbi:MAG TPA: hypothetical protein VFE32_02865 [Puia sp.]|jgi:hypothetical protein|nr:hypothetical protein [Puia sp.]